MKPAIRSSILAETTHGRSQSGEAMPLKRLLGGLTMLAAAVALIAASAVPSHADRRSDNIAKVIVGALIVGAIVNEVQKDKRKPPVHPVDSRRVPGACAIEIESASQPRPVVVYGGTCLREYGLTRLPACGRSATIYGRAERLYSPDCLRGAGFSVPRR
jgi:hypothetical protein